MRKFAERRFGRTVRRTGAWMVALLLALAPAPALSRTAAQPSAQLESRGCRVAGLAFHDRNGNETPDAGELPLAGAEFRLTVPGEQTREAISDEAGQFSFDGLVPGAYLLQEVAAPSGFRPWELEKRFVLGPGEVFIALAGYKALGDPTSTPTSAPTLGPTITPTDTRPPPPTPTPTATPSATSVGTATPDTTRTPVPTDLLTAEATATPSPTATGDAVATETPSATPTDAAMTPPAPRALYLPVVLIEHPAPAVTETPTGTKEPTSTATLVASPTASATPTVSPTATPSPSPTAAWTRTMTASPSPTATDAGACARYEPNETNAQAYGPAGNGETLRAALCPGDAWDLYYFVLGSGAEAQIDLTEIPDGVDYDLYLYPGGGGAPIASSTAPGSMAERIRVALSPGRYLVRVYPATGSSEAEYSLRVGW